MKVHECSGEPSRMSGVVLLPLPYIYEALGEPEAIVRVVATAAPYPVLVEFLGPTFPTAATGSEFTFPTGAGDGVNDASRRDGVSKGGFSTGCKQKGKLGHRK